MLDITVSLDHFDKVVILPFYTQYDDFNMSYLTFSSIGLLLLSHFVTPVYWALLQNKPDLNLFNPIDSPTVQMLKSKIPYIPIILPILLFCKLAEIKLEILSLHDEKKIFDVAKIWHLMKTELRVENIANDVKIIGKNYILLICFLWSCSTQSGSQYFGQLLPEMDYIWAFSYCR